VLRLHAPADAAGPLPGRRALDRQFALGSIVGEDAGLLAVLRQVSQVAATDASVLIEGESGTGKELIAEALHQNSARRDQAFVKVNLGLSPPRCLKARCLATGAAPSPTPAPTGWAASS